IAKNIIQQLNNKPEEEAKYSAKAKKEHDFLNETEEANQTNSFLHGLWTICKLAILALAIALLLRTYVFEITKVDGSSMSPTLETGDNLLTSKISYLIDHPQRGDIVIIEAPDKNNIFYVKRIVGLPNDKITIKNGQVYINEQLLSEDYLNDIYTTGEINTIVEENGYFVLGDNRASSHDSRSNSVGNIMEDDIIGKAILRLYPMDRFGKLE
ncbi:MAG: signal peptidase I, partial [Clostridiales bacterium]